MPEIKPVFDGNLDPIQAAELAVVVELEARWENLRTPGQKPIQAPHSIQDLQAKQKAYEAFRVKLAAYNKKFTPAHIPELLLNTSLRLAAWCRGIRKLYLQIENNPQGHNPTHLLEKAYRWADLVAGKEHKTPITRAAPPASLTAAIADLDAIGKWCADSATIAA